MSNTHYVERMSSLDLTLPAGYVAALLVFPTEATPSTLLPRLQGGLDLLCERVPWLAGRLFPIERGEPRRSALEVRCTAQDPPLRIIDGGTISGTYDDLSRVGFPLERIPADLWPVSSLAPVEPGSGSVVFVASLFRFGDGRAVGLCIQAHHNTVDGFGFGEIIRFWALATTGQNSSLPEPAVLSNRSGRLTEALKRDLGTTARPSLEVLYGKHPEYSGLPPKMPAEPQACTSEILTIPMEKIQTIKEKLGSHMSKPPSTNTVACTLLWSAVTRARMQRVPELESQTSRLPMAVNGRKRIHERFVDPEAPYLGNVVLCSWVEAAARDVAKCGRDDSIELLAETCAKVAQSLSPDRINTGYIGEVCDLVEQLDDHRALYPGWDLFGSRDLFITSWADLGLYGHDFGDGLGKARFVRIPYAEVNGNVIILPRRQGASVGEVSEEGLEMVVMLRRDDLEVLKRDSLWKVSN